MERVIRRGGREFPVVTVIVKYVYDETPTAQQLLQIIVACIPNGHLQERYNPNPDDTIWLAGRNAPSRGEEFRVRLSYARLRAKAPWRIRQISLGGEGSAP